MSESEQRVVRIAAEAYERSLDELCTCYSDPDRRCKHCSLIEKARQNLELLIGHYTQL